LDDIAGKEVHITEVEFKTGNFGPYAVMAIPDENGELQHVMTSAMLILDALENAVAAEALPLDATFKKRGRCWIVE
jgi:hypothetical protein